MLRKLLITFFFMGICLGMSACFESKEPLSPPEESPGDESLKGVWHAEIAGNDVYLHIIPLQKPWLQVIQVTHVNIGGTYDLEKCEVFPTMANGMKFMNVKFLVPKSPENQEEFETRYWFYKYEVSKDGTLSLWSLKYQELKQALTEKKLKGKHWETTWGANIQLNEPGEKILHYLSSGDIEKKFELEGQFRRIKTQ